MAVQIYYVQCALCKDACIMMSNNFLANYTPGDSRFFSFFCYFLIKNEAILKLL